MTRPDLSRLSPEEKDALILALLDRVAALEARLGQPPKTPGNSGVPPSRGQKADRPPRRREPRRKRDGPGVTRDPAADPDHAVDCHARACAHCGTAVTAEGQALLRHAYDHVDLPSIRPVVTRGRIFGRRCPGCRRRVRGTPPETMPPGSPFGPSVVTMLAYLHHHRAVGYDRLSGLMAEPFGLRISEGAVANALRRANRPLGRAGAAIAERLRRAAVIGCDEAGARLTTDALGTRMGWEWVLVSDTAVLHRIRTSRGRDVVAEVLGGHRPRAAGCPTAGARSRDTPTRTRSASRPCPARRPVRRGCRRAPLRAGPAPPPALGQRRRRAAGGLEGRHPGPVPRAKADRRLDRLVAMPTIAPAGAELRRQTKRWRGQFFTFMTERDVPPTNNAAERALRPSVIFRKVTNGFRSIWGADVPALVRSAIGTGRLNGLTPYQAIARSPAGQPITAA